MAEQLKIFTQQLSEDARETINLTLAPDFLDLKEDELRASSPVKIEGEAYVLDDMLMVQLEVETTIEMPCSICNKMTKVQLENKNVVVSLPLSELPSSVFDYTDLLREEIVMLIPPFAECKKNGCPERASLKPKPKEPSQNFPFADLH